MKLQYILEIWSFVNYFVIVCLLGIICISLSILVKKFQLVTKIYQNQYYIYFGGFKCLVYYNLVVCYSLHPILVIWYVILVVFLEIQWYLSKLKKSKFWYAKFGSCNFEKTAVLVI